MRRIDSHKDHNISTCTLSECLSNYESLCQQNCTTTVCFSRRCTKNREMCYSIGLSGPSFISSAAPVATTPTAAPLLHLSSPEAFSLQTDQTIKHVIIATVTPCPATPHLPPPSVLCHTKNVHTLPVGNYMPASCLTAADRARKNKSGLCFPFFLPAWRSDSNTELEKFGNAWK